MVCLDTSFIIALIRRDRHAERRLEEHLASDTKLSTTPITACELYKGAYRSSRGDAEVEKVRRIVSHMEVLEFSAEACERFGKLVNSEPLRSAPIGDMDSMIASIAMTHNEPLATSDKRHFSKVPGLLVDSWLPE